MNIFCHSSVTDIESDDNGSLVFADSESGEKGTSVSASENPDECRKMLKTVNQSVKPFVGAFLMTFIGILVPLELF